MCKEDKGDPLVDRLRALASTASMAIIGVLASHRPHPVPVGALSVALGMTRTTTSTHLARLRKVHLVRIQDRRKGGYVANSAEIRAVIGGKNYRKITQGFGHCQNDDTPSNPNS